MTDHLSVSASGVWLPFDWDNGTSGPLCLSSSNKLAWAYSLGGLKDPRRRKVCKVWRPRLRTGALSFLPYSIAQSKSQSQSRFKGWEIDSVSFWEELSHMAKIMDIKKHENVLPFL